MNKKGLTDVQLKIIEMVVQGDKSITEICDECSVGRTTYYYWINNSKAFNDALDEAIETKVREAKKNIKINVNKYIDTLNKLSATGKNEAARVNAIAKLMTLAELDPQYKQEVIIKNDDHETKNALLEMLKEDKDE